MKELFESAFYQGYRLCQEESGLTNLITPCEFHQWWDNNKSNIDSAIEQYLKEQGKCIIDKSKIIDYLGQLEEIKQDVISIPDNSFNI